MKPIKLKVKGLNSFIEEQVIDFGKLTSKGLFGIFGPTGSGKSTILDGITLALYGDLSRKSSNYINTNCKTLSVSYEFQISSSTLKKYRVNRDFKRDSKTGAPRAAGVQLLDITKEEPEVLADKVNAVNKACQEIIGLSLEDFTRTVVLPQGKFSEFLKLEGKQRREMLERLFNLQNYGDNLSSKLSSEIYKERNEYNILSGELKGFEGITTEVINSREEELKIKSDNLNNLIKLVEDINNEFKEKEELWKLQNELLKLNQEEEALKSREQEINEYKEKVDRASHAWNVNPYITAYERTLENISEVKKNTEALKSKVFNLLQLKEKAEETFKNIKRRKDDELPNFIIKEEKVLSALEEEKTLKALEEENNINKIEINKLRAVYKDKELKIKEKEEEINIINSKIKTFEKEIEGLNIEESLKAGVQKGILVEDRFNSLEKNYKDNVKKKCSLIEAIEKEKNEVNKLNPVLLEKNNLFKNVTEELDNLIKEGYLDNIDLLKEQRLVRDLKDKLNVYEENIQIINKTKNEKDKLESELNEKLKLKENELNKFQKLKKDYEEIKIEYIAHELRKNLRDGEVCPVCGALHHNLENIKINEYSNINNIEQDIQILEGSIKVLEEEITIIKTKICSQEEKLSECNNILNSIEGNINKEEVEKRELQFIKLQEDTLNFNKAKEKLEKQKELLKEEIFELNTKINKFKTILEENNKQLELINEDIAVSSEELETNKKELNELKKEFNINNFKNANKLLVEKEREKNKKEKELKDNREKLDILNKEREAFKNELSVIKEDGAALKSKIEEKNELAKSKREVIKSKVGEQTDLTSYLSSIRDEIKTIEESFKKEEENKEIRDKQYQEYNEKLLESMGKESQLLSKSKEEKENIENALKNEGFECIEGVKKKLLSREEINKINTLIESYKEKLSKIIGTIESLEKKRNNKSITEDEWISVQNIKKEKEELLEHEKEEVIKLEQEIKNLHVKMNQLEELIKNKEKIEHKLALLNDLEKLFKGKRFVEFVATTRLKYISLEASKKLKEISNGNYGLEVDENSKFIIRDYKNGGAERDASTLSGGETFLASLALALALSSEIQLKGTAPLELFFLDEGFGTLDDNLLEVVMNSLERIHNNKLSVGIISHVESIKNRIPVKLLITPAKAGMGGSKVKIDI